MAIRNRNRALALGLTLLLAALAFWFASLSSDRAWSANRGSCSSFSWETNLGGSAGVPDMAAPRATVRAGGRPAAGRPIAIEVSCGEECLIAATGRVMVWGMPPRGLARATHSGQARFGLKRATRRLIAGQRQTLRLRPRSRRAKRRLTRLLARGGKARVAIRVKATDSALNSSTRRMTVRLRRG